MDNNLDVSYIEESENDVDKSFQVEIEEGPSEEVIEATETGDASGLGSLQLLDGGVTLTSRADAALERNAPKEPIRFVQI